uniref:LRRNT domain-containing protein n=1 Tax=Gopherus agassizii TaxID=38772 RepID=A0A452J360_9SAUR
MIPVLFPLLFGYILSLPDCPQKCLCTPSLMDCRSASLYEVPHGIAQKTETLILNDNHLTLISPEVFQHLLNLTFLGLANNKLSLQNDSFDNIVFDPIPNLKILVLSHNEISHLPEGLFDNLKSLNDLLLDYNNFTEISHAIFTTLHNLEHFSVSKNRIQTIPPLLFASRSPHLPLMPGSPPPPPAPIVSPLADERQNHLAHPVLAGGEALGKGAEKCEWCTLGEGDQGKRWSGRRWSEGEVSGGKG